MNKNLTKLTDKKPVKNCTFQYTSKKINGFNCYILLNNWKSEKLFYIGIIEIDYKKFTFKNLLKLRKIEASLQYEKYEKYYFGREINCICFDTFDNKEEEKTIEFVEKKLYEITKEMEKL